MIRSKSMLNSAHLPFRVNSVFARNNCIQRTIPDQRKKHNPSTLRKITVSLISFHSMSVTAAFTHVLQPGVNMCFKKI